MARITLENISLADLCMAERVSELRQAYFRAAPEICIERPRLVTRYSVESGFLRQPRISILDKARTYRYVLECRTPVVRHGTAYDAEMKPF